MHCPLCQSADTEIYFQENGKRDDVKIYHACRNCRLIFLAPQFFLNRQKELERYNLHQNDPGDQRYITFLKQLTGPLVQRLPEKSRGLDFGCGPGPAIASILKKQGHDVRNYDPFYFPDRTLIGTQYDFVTCSETVEHFYAPRLEFKLFNHLLKSPGGVLAIMTRMKEEGVSFADWWYRSEPTHVCFYSKETFQWIAGWQEWDIEFPAPHVVIYRKNKIDEKKSQVRRSA